MSVAERFLTRVQPLLPLTIAHVSWGGEQLVFGGEDWTCNVTTCWRLVRDQRLIVGCTPDAEEQVVELLKGADVVNIILQTQVLAADPVFHLSGGLALEIFSESAVDPWFFRLPDITFVGSPADPG